VLYFFKESGKNQVGIIIVMKKDTKGEKSIMARKGWERRGAFDEEHGPFVDNHSGIYSFLLFTGLFSYSRQGQ